MKSNELTVNELEIVAGGTMEENQALAKFIREVDPGYKIVRDADVIKWLKEKSGLNFKTLKLSFSYYFICIFVSHLSSKDMVCFAYEKCIKNINSSNNSLTLVQLMRLLKD